MIKNLKNGNVVILGEVVTNIIEKKWQDNFQWCSTFNGVSVMLSVENGQIKITAF